MPPKKTKKGNARKVAAETSTRRAATKNLSNTATSQSIRASEDVFVLPSGSFDLNLHVKNSLKN